MSGRKSKLLRKQEEMPVVPEVSSKVSVDTLQLPDALHFTAQFSFDIKTGRNNFTELSNVVDNEINSARNQILEKIANKLGVKVNFTN